jgi:hypothetical protein
MNSGNGPAHAGAPTVADGGMWHVVASGTEDATAALLLSLAAAPEAPIAPFTTSWRIDDQQQVLWRLADGTEFDLQLGRALLLKRALDGLAHRSDVTPRDRRGAILAVGRLADALSDAADRLKPEETGSDAFSTYLTQLNLLRARSIASDEAMLFRRIALEALEQLPEGMVSSDDLASERSAAESSTSRAAAFRTEFGLHAKSLPGARK